MYATFLIQIHTEYFLSTPLYFAIYLKIRTYRGKRCGQLHDEDKSTQTKFNGKNLKHLKNKVNNRMRLKHMKRFMMWISSLTMFVNLIMLNDDTPSQVKCIQLLRRFVLGNLFVVATNGRSCGRSYRRYLLNFINLNCLRIYMCLLSYFSLRYCHFLYHSHFHYSCRSFQHLISTTRVINNNYWLLLLSATY